MAGKHQQLSTGGDWRWRIYTEHAIKQQLRATARPELQPTRKEEKLPCDIEAKIVSSMRSNR